MWGPELGGPYEAGGGLLVGGGDPMLGSRTDRISNINHPLLQTSFSHLLSHYIRSGSIFKTKIHGNRISGDLKDLQNDKTADTSCLMVLKIHGSKHQYIWGPHVQKYGGPKKPATGPPKFGERP